MVCVFKHLYCSAQLSMSNMEKRYRNKIIITIISGTSATGKAGMEPRSAALEADTLTTGPTSLSIEEDSQGDRTVNRFTV